MSEANFEWAWQSLRQAMCAYYPLTETSWLALRDIAKARQLTKGQLLYRAGELPKSFAFVAKGLIRGYVCAEDGAEYNKKFFTEGMFPGSMTALLKSEPSQLEFEALEDSLVIELDFKGYRQLLLELDDLKLYQIHYLEQNWLLDKDAREIEIVQEDATARYQRFVHQFPELAARLPQYHIASHLGITPTQLSRIRKNL